MVKEYSALIIDDDKLSYTNLKSQLGYYLNVRVVGYASNPIDGAAAILEQKPDLLFLDVEMPVKNGFQMLQEVSHSVTWPMQVIFHSAYDKYLLEAIRNSAFDFLLKPLDTEDLKVVMDRFFKLKDQPSSGNFFQASFSEVIPSDMSFMVATAVGFQVLQRNQIGYFAYSGKRRLWAVYLANGSELFLRRNAKAKDILQYSTSFVQINQQYIINIEYLAAIKGHECLMCAPFDAVSGLDISRGNYKLIQEKFTLI